MESPDTADEPTPPGTVDLPGSNGLVGRIGLAVFSGLIVGATTEWSALHLPFDLKPLSNAAAPWILVAFAAALTAGRTRHALVLSTAALLALIAGFYAAQTTRGWPLDEHQIAFWCAATVIVGPLTGVAAGWIRHASDPRSAVGAGILGGVLAGEALHGLSQAAFLSPHVYWYAQLGLGIGLGATLTLHNLHSRGARALPVVAASFIAFGMTTLTTLAAYQIS